MPRAVVVCTCKNWWTCCVQISWYLSDWKSVNSCAACLTKNISPGSPVDTTARIATKICQGQPPTIHSKVLQISSKSVRFRRSYSQNEPYTESNIRLKPSFEPNKKKIIVNSIGSQALSWVRRSSTVWPASQDIDKPVTVIAVLP